MRNTPRKIKMNSKVFLRKLAYVEREVEINPRVLFVR
jgi:hypothetical protein